MRQVAEALLETVPTALIPQLELEFRRGWHQEAVKAQINQRQIAADTHRADHKSVDGLGRLRMRIDGTAYHYWGQKLGYDCWRDSQFLREFERDNPEVRVKSAGTKTQVGFSGQPKFRKTYA